MESKERLERGAGSKTKGGGESMKKFLLAVLMLVVSGLAFAVSPDTIVLTVNPVFSLSVNISSATHSLGTGAGYANDVVLGTSRTVCVGEIENDGNVSSKWQKMATSITDAGSNNEWYLLEDPKVGPGQDTFQLLAITTGTSADPNLSTGSSGDDKMILGDLAKIIVTSTTYTDLTEGGTDSPVHPKAEKRSMWVSILMPPNITTDGTQSITLSVRAIVQ